MSILPDKRSGIHIPIGLINVALYYACPLLGLGFTLSFLAYEKWQGGNPHKDIVGSIWGLGIGGVVWFIISLI